MNKLEMWNLYESRILGLGKACKPGLTYLLKGGNLRYLWILSRSDLDVCIHYERGEGRKEEESIAKARQKRRKTKLIPVWDSVTERDPRTKKKTEEKEGSRWRKQSLQWLKLLSVITDAISNPRSLTEHCQFRLLYVAQELFSLSLKRPQRAAPNAAGESPGAQEPPTLSSLRWSASCRL